MHTKWISDCKTPEEKKKRKELLHSCSDAFDILKALMVKELESLEINSKTDYDNPSWAYKQADTNGVMRTLDKYINLIKDLDNE